MPERIYKRSRQPENYLLRQVVANRQIAEWEDLCGRKAFSSVWDMWDLGTWSYARRLGVKDGYFRSFVSDYRDQTGLEPFGLDVGSSTGALRELGIPGVAISMGEPRKKARQAEDGAQNLHLVAGDILLPSTWRTGLASKMESAAIPNFQLIMAFPYGGLQYLTDSPAVHYEILQRMWRVLDPNGGLLALEMTTSHFELSSLKIIQQAGWIDFLNTIGGIEAKLYQNAWRRQGGITLKRSPEAPDNLPLNFRLTEDKLKKHRGFQQIHLENTIDWLKSLKRDEV